jgi:hypothetical protein
VAAPGQLLIYPNPCILAQGPVFINYTLFENSNVELVIYNYLGHPLMNWAWNNQSGSVSGTSPTFSFSPL